MPKYLSFISSSSSFAPLFSPSFLLSSSPHLSLSIHLIESYGITSKGVEPVFAMYMLSPSAGSSTFENNSDPSAGSNTF
jgi:hypothetical protein